MNTLQYPEILRQGRAACVYDEFLYAQLGEEANGMQLSVLSALARQNVDPWEIAQRLTSLPREPAILYLTPLLARTPAGLAAPQDTAARLIAIGCPNGSANNSSSRTGLALAPILWPRQSFTRRWMAIRSSWPARRTQSRWRRRYVAKGMDGLLKDATRP